MILGRGRSLDADAAVRLLPAGARILASPACSTPGTLLDALGRLAPDRPGMTVLGGMLLGPLAWLDSVVDRHLRYRSWHLAGDARGLADRSLVDYLPLRLGDVPAFLPGKVDAMVVRVSPPDRSGRSSIGPSGSYTLAGVRAVRAAGGTLLAEVDASLPHTSGDTALDLGDFAAVIEADSPTCLHLPAARSELHDRIADAVLALLPPAPTVQLGIGAVPEAVTAALAGVAGGVGVVGMAGDGIIGLDGSGALASRPGRAPVTAVEVIGTSDLMAFVDRNPSVEVHSSEVVHDPGWLASIPRFVSINSALEVDLTGQVALESAGGRSLGGLGGAIDFFDGARASVGGLRIVALQSTDRSGATSKIVTQLGPGTPVSVPRHAVDAVVTEHGVAWLRGASLVERVDALVGVAAPAWRDRLADAAGRGGR